MGSLGSIIPKIKLFFQPFKNSWVLAVSEQDDIINTCKKVGQGSIPAPYKLKKNRLLLKFWPVSAHSVKELSMKI